ncbi:MAG: hypothetical protein H0W50_10335 [Parachlamydiaceae bacterium]|nr:hypothetical protein [Parachlamydiaceae bacterium]
MNLTKLKSFLLLTLSMQACIFPVRGEVERITVKWEPLVCKESCVQGIVRELVSVAGVAEIVINSDQGAANIRWKPRLPFSFTFISNAVGVIGPRILDARVQVRGTLLATNSAILLESLGDNTRFVLMSPAKQTFSGNVPQNSFETHILAPELRQQFMDGIRDSCVVTVKGPLLQWQQGGLYLIVEEATFNRLGGNSIRGSSTP